MGCECVMKCTDTGAGAGAGDCDSVTVIVTVQFEVIHLKHQ